MLINKNQFNIKNTKKVLHKIGKKWVVVSAVLLGLLGGGVTAVSANTTTNVQPSVTAQARQSKKNIPTTKPTVQSNANATISGSNGKSNPQISNASYSSNNVQNFKINSALASSEALKQSDMNVDVTNNYADSINNSLSANSASNIANSIANRDKNIINGMKNNINSLENNGTNDANSIANSIAESGSKTLASAKNDKADIDNALKSFADDGIFNPNISNINKLANENKENRQNANSIANSIANKDQNIINGMKSNINSLEHNGTNSADSIANSIAKSASNNVKSAHNAFNSLNNNNSNPIADSIASSMAKSINSKNGAKIASAKSAYNSLMKSANASVAKSIASSKAKNANKKPAKPNTPNNNGGDVTPNNNIIPSDNNGGYVPSEPVNPAPFIPNYSPATDYGYVFPSVNNNVASNNNYVAPTNENTVSSQSNNNGAALSSDPLVAALESNNVVVKPTTSNSKESTNKEPTEHTKRVNNIANNYLTRNNFNFKRGHKNAVITIRGLVEGRFTRRGSFVKVAKVRKNTLLNVRRVIKLGKANVLQLTNGNFITANKHFVRVSKRFAKKSAYTRALSVANRNVRRARGRYAKRYARNIVRGLVRAHKSEVRAVAKFNRHHNSRNRKTMKRAEYRVNYAVRALLK